MKTFVKNDPLYYVKGHYSKPEIVKEYTSNKLFPSEEIIIQKYFKANTTVLDIGCGVGRTSIALTKMGYDITAFDLVPEMVKEAKLCANAQKLKIKFSVKNALDMVYPEGSFQNVLFSFNGIDNIQGKTNREIFLKNVFNILKSDGCFIFTIRSGFAFGRRIIYWIWMLMTYPKMKLFSQNNSWELGDRLRNGLFMHYLNPFTLKNISQKIGFELLCFNSSANILKGKKANFFTNFSNDKMIYFVLKKS